jgi:uncharacterized membrane protein SpoIIM required for sporulation
MRIGEAYRESIETAKRLKHLLIFFAAAHVIFYVFGEWAVAREFPYVMELRNEQLAELRDMAFIKPLTGPLADNLPLKILYTFFFNLIFGAFVSTTLTGVFLFFLPYVIAVWRGFIIGVLFHGIDSSSAHLVFYGTFILEFGAYTFSSVAGTDMGLSVLFPGRKGAESRREALMRAWLDAKKLYLFVIVLLAVGAIWEMSLLHYLAPTGGEAAGLETPAAVE